MSELQDQPEKKVKGETGEQLASSS